MNRADLYRFRSTRTSLWVRFLATGMMQAQRSQPSLPAHSPKRGSMRFRGSPIPPRCSRMATCSWQVETTQLLEEVPSPARSYLTFNGLVDTHAQHDYCAREPPGCAAAEW